MYRYVSVLLNLYSNTSNLCIGFYRYEYIKFMYQIVLIGISVNVWKVVFHRLIGWSDGGGDGYVFFNEEEDFDFWVGNSAGIMVNN